MISEPARNRQDWWFRHIRQDDPINHNMSAGAAINDFKVALTANLFG
jgi:hypothetical protein